MIICIVKEFKINMCKPICFTKNPLIFFSFLSFFERQGVGGSGGGGAE